MKIKKNNFYQIVDKTTGKIVDCLKGQYLYIKNTIESDYEVIKNSMAPQELILEENVLVCDANTNAYMIKRWDGKQWVLVEYRVMTEKKNILSTVYTELYAVYRALEIGFLLKSPVIYTDSRSVFEILYMPLHAIKNTIKDKDDIEKTAKKIKKYDISVLKKWNKKAWGENPADLKDVPNINK